MWHVELLSLDLPCYLQHELYLSFGAFHLAFVTLLGLLLYAETLSYVLPFLYRLYVFGISTDLYRHYTVQDLWSGVEPLGT